MKITREFVRNVRRRLVEDENVTSAMLAKDFIVPEAYVIMAFPVKSRIRANNESLDDLWSELSAVPGLGINKEMLSENFFSHGKVMFIWFVSHHNRDELKFFDADGHLLLLVPFWTKKGSLPDTFKRELFIRLQRKYGVVSKPPLFAFNRCNSHACGKKGQLTRCCGVKKQHLASSYCQGHNG